MKQHGTVNDSKTLSIREIGAKAPGFHPGQDENNGDEVILVTGEFELRIELNELSEKRSGGEKNTFPSYSDARSNGMSQAGEVY